MPRIYEYTVITAKSIYELSDLVTEAIGSHPDVQPYEGIVIFPEHTELGEMTRYAQVIAYWSKE